MMNKKLITTNQDSHFSIVGLLTLAFIAQGIVLGFTVLLPFVQADFILSRGQIGLYSTFLFFSSFIMALFSGWIVDFFGVKLGLVTGVFILGLFMFLHAFPNSYWMLLILAFFTGLGHSMVMPAANKGIIEWISPKTRTMAMGITQSGEGIGIILSSIILPTIAKQTSWHWAAICSGFFTLVNAFLIKQRYREKYYIQRKKVIHLRQLFGHFQSNIKRLLKSPYFLSMSILGFAFGTASCSTITYLVLFLNQDLNLTNVFSGFGLGILQIGGIVGRIFWGWLKDTLYWRNRTKSILLTVGLVIVTFSILFAYVVTSVTSSLFIIAFSIFLLGSSNLGWTGVLFSSIADIIGEESSGTAMGLVLVFVRFGLLFSPPIFGLIADYYGCYKYSWYFLGYFVFIIVIIFFLLAGKYENEHR